MEQRYHPESVEPKWQKKWDEQQLFRVSDVNLKMVIQKRPQGC